MVEESNTPKYAHDMMLVAGTPDAMNLWEWIDFYGEGLGAVAGITAAVVAIVALIAATSDNRARSQPMVTAELRPAIDSDTAATLVITNVGPTPARDVNVRFDPELVVPESGDRLLTSFIVRRYKNPIPVLNPGQQLSNTWWSGKNVGGNELVNREPLPDEFTVHLQYRGLRGRKQKDSFPLTMDSVKLTTVAESSTSTKGRIGSIDASLKKLVTADASLRKLATASASIATAMTPPVRSGSDEEDAAEILRLVGFGEPNQPAEPESKKWGKEKAVRLLRKLASRLF